MFFLELIKLEFDGGKFSREIIDERDWGSLSTLKLSYEEAVHEYENRKNTRLGTLVANRELPVLLKAKEIIEDINKGKTVAQCLADRTDYSENAKKTNDGEFISSYIRKQIG